MLILKYSFYHLYISQVVIQTCHMQFQLQGVFCSQCIFFLSQVLLFWVLWQFSRAHDPHFHPSFQETALFESEDYTCL